MWLLTLDMYHVTWDMCHVTCDTWQATGYRWQVGTIDASLMPIKIFFKFFYLRTLRILKGLDTSPYIMTAILKFLIPVSISRLGSWKSQTSLNIKTAILQVSIWTSLNIMTAILKVSIPVSISRLQPWKSQYQSQYHDCNPKSLDISLDIKTKFPKVLISIWKVKPSLAHQCL